MAPSTHISALNDLSTLQMALDEAILTCEGNGLPAAPLCILKAAIPVIKTNLHSGRFNHPGKTERFVIAFGKTMMEEYNKRPAQREHKCWAMYLDRPSTTASLHQLFAGLNLVLNFHFGLAARATLNKAELDSFEADTQVLLDAIRKGFSWEFERKKKNKPVIGFLALTGAVSDYHFGHFSVRKAMQHTWVATSRLVKSHRAELPKKVQDLDSYVVALSRLIYEPGLFLSLVARIFNL